MPRMPTSCRDLVSTFTLIALIGGSQDALAQTERVERAFFDATPHQALDFTLDGDGDPVQPPGGSLDMITEYASLGIQMDNSAITFQWVMTADLPELAGALGAEVSDPVVVKTFGFNAVQFDTPVRAFGVTLIMDSLPASLFIANEQRSFGVDASFVVASEEAAGVMRYALFLGIASDAPFSTVTFGIPEGGEFHIDDILYTAAGCSADLSMDGAVDGADLAALLAQWGTADANADLTGDGVVDGADLAALLSAWNNCVP